MVDRWRRSSRSRSPSTAQNLSASLVSGARCWGTSYRRHQRGLLPGSLIRRHPVITFFILAYALTWVLVPFGIFNAGGPLLAALITTAVTRGRAGLRELGSRLIRWRVGWGWYAVAVGLPLAAHLITVGVNLMLGAPAPSLTQLAPWYTVLLVFAARLINTLEGALGEEPGWRGFSLPHLQATRSPLAATAILAGLVALWHTPLLLPRFGMRPFELVGVVAVTFFFCWLFNRTGGSILVPLVAHAAEGSIDPTGFWAGVSGAAESRSRVLYVLVWCAIAIGLLVFDATRWHRPAPASATARPAPRTREGAPAGQAAGPGGVIPGVPGGAGALPPGGNAGRGRWAMRPRTFLAWSALLAGVLLVTGTAVAGTGPHTVGPYKVKELRVASGPSPFPAGCPGARFDNTAIAG
jgi:membrane protease YdiL (CAAX protease family)